MLFIDSVVWSDVVDPLPFHMLTPRLHMNVPTQACNGLDPWYVVTARQDHDIMYSGQW